jgi:Mn2+/Fe2+ NRAMP family transporter
VPVFVMVHPPLAQVAHDFLVHHVSQGAKLRRRCFGLVGIVGTTVAPWQLFFFQQAM